METANKGRRAVLAAAATAAAAGIAPVLAHTAPAGNFGAPVIELYVPVGVLTAEQKSAVIKGFTDVVLKALDRAPEASRRLFMTIIETAEGGFGVNGQVFVRK
jgi:phenylpyruvate tautomerase PptA (4-oxalocrotonate tautomerase family)